MVALNLITLLSLAAWANALPQAAGTAGCNAPWIQTASKLAKLVPNSRVPSLCSTYLGKYVTATSTSAKITATATITQAVTQTQINTVTSTAHVTITSAVVLTATEVATVQETSTLPGLVTRAALSPPQQDVPRKKRDVAVMEQDHALEKRGVREDIARLLGIAESAASQFCGCIATGSPSTSTKIVTAGASTVITVTSTAQVTENAAVTVTDTETITEAPTTTTVTSTTKSIIPVEATTTVAFVRAAVGAGCSPNTQVKREYNEGFDTVNNVNDCGNMCAIDTNCREFAYERYPWTADGNGVAWCYLYTTTGNAANVNCQVPAGDYFVYYTKQG